MMMMINEISEDRDAAATFFDLYPALGPAALCCALLSLQCLGMAQALGLLRVLHQSFLPPEDYLVSQGGAAPKRNNDSDTAAKTPTPSNSSNEEKSIVCRLFWAQRNTTENVPHFMVIAILCALALGQSPLNSAVMECRTLLVVYGIARFLYVLFYVGGIQPHRTMTFIVGAMCHCFLLGRLLALLLPLFVEEVPCFSSAWLTKLPFILITPLVFQALHCSFDQPRVPLMAFSPVTAAQARAAAESNSKKKLK